MKTIIKTVLISAIMLFALSNSTNAQTRKAKHRSRTTATSKRNAGQRKATASKTDYSWLNGNWRYRMYAFGVPMEMRVGISGDIIAVFIDGEHHYTGEYTIEGDRLVYNRHKGWSEFLVIDKYSRRLKADYNNYMERFPSRTVIERSRPEPEYENYEDNQVYETVDQQPTFPGGQSALLQWLGQTVHYPAMAEEQGIQGRVVVSLVIEKDGSISNIKVARGVDPLLDKEAVRVVKSMPRWTPGRLNGQAVRVKYNVPITFSVQ